MKLRPVATAPLNERVLATDGEWWAVVIVYGPPEYDTRRVTISHYAVSQEYDWEPTHWVPMPKVSM